MKFTLTQGLKIVICVLAILFFYAVVSKKAELESYTRVIGVITFVIFYFLESRRKSLFFGGFLMFFSLAEISKVYFNNSYEVFSNTTNTFSITAYSLFIFYICNTFSFSKLLKRFWGQAIILFFTSSYIIYNLNEIIFTSNIIEINSVKYVIETTYNIVVFTLVSIALLNFLYHDNKRSLLLFIVCVFFTLAEIIQVPYLFLASTSHSFKIAFSLLYVIGYYFIYLYTTTKFNKQYKILN